MGLLARSFAPVRNIGSFAPIAIPTWVSGRAALQNGKYETFAKEGYQKNELVYAAIEELSTSAAEPRLRAKVRGEWKHEHPVLDILNRPNPFMDRFEFFATVILHRSLAGNAYALIVRSASGKARELWLMRPDRVAVVPDKSKYISRFEYTIGSETVALPVEDVIHWKTRNPVNDFYGMPPLMAAAGRVDIDNFMKDFVKTYFEKAGVPAGMLNIEGAADPTFKEEIKQRFGREFGGSQNWHGLLVIDQKKASFTPMTANLGPSGLVVPELDEINEARILMVFQVPPELIGARVGMQNSSYAQKRSARESFWDETLAPLYKELEGPINLRLRPNFPNVEEIGFDLSDVRALQEDVDKVSARTMKELMSGARTIEESRKVIGLAEKVETGTFLLPANLVPVAASKVADDSVDLSSVRTGGVGGPEQPVESDDSAA